MAVTAMEALIHPPSTDCLWEAATDASIFFSQKPMPRGTHFLYQELAQQVNRPDVMRIGGHMWATLQALLPLLRAGRVPVAYIMCQEEFRSSLEEISGVGECSDIPLRSFNPGRVVVEPPFILHLESKLADPSADAHVWFVRDQEQFQRESADQIGDGRTITGIVVLGTRVEDV